MRTNLFSLYPWFCSLEDPAKRPSDIVPLGVYGANVVLDTPSELKLTSKTLTVILLLQIVVMFCMKIT